MQCARYVRDRKPGSTTHKYSSSSPAFARNTARLLGHNTRRRVGITPCAETLSFASAARPPSLQVCCGRPAPAGALSVAIGWTLFSLTWWKTANGSAFVPLLFVLSVVTGLVGQIVARGAGLFVVSGVIFGAAMVGVGRQVLLAAAAAQSGSTGFSNDDHRA